jgi:hypothetical protein
MKKEENVPAGSIRYVSSMTVTGLWVSFLMDFIYFMYAN